jgi:hypothetical protein
LLSSSVMDTKFSAIKIPSIDMALSDMRSGIVMTLRVLAKIRDASISLEETTKNSNYVDVSVHHEVIALKLSAHNLERSLDLPIIDSGKDRITRNIAEKEIENPCYSIDCR